MCRVISESDVCWRRSQETFEKITDAAANLESKGADVLWLEMVLTALQAQMLTLIDCCKVWLRISFFSRACMADPSRPTSARRVAEKRCRLYSFAEGQHSSFSRSPFPEHSPNLFGATELLYRTMHKSSAPNKHTKRRSCTTATSSLVVASKFPGEDELLAYPTVTQHAVCVRCHDRRNRPEKGVL